MIGHIKAVAARYLVAALLLLGGLLPAFATQSVTFVWDPISDPSAVGYNVYFGTASHVYTNKVSVGNVSTATVTGLVEGATYYFAACTYNAQNQESDLSDEIVYTVPLSVPGQPPVIVALTATNTAIVGQQVTFNVATSGTNSMSYQWSCNNNSIPAATNATLTLNNVTPGQSGTYYVTVSDAAGTTNSSSVTLTVYPTTAPTLTSVQHVNGMFTLSLTGVTNYQYIVQASTDLLNWVPVSTNVAPFTFVDVASAQFSQRFYRAFCSSP